MPAPLLVHLVFHPQDATARALARSLHAALNGDPVLPGLALPTVLLREDGSGRPPVKHDLDEAEHSAVVVFAGDEIAADDPPDAGPSWPDFIAGLAAQCASGRHRLLPVQLTASAWPLHDALRQTSFLHADREPENARPAWIERRIVIELCRFLMRLSRGDQAPVTIFLSHAKQDADAPPRLFEALVAHLDATKPISAWVDTGRIEPGGDFTEAIARGVGEAAVLVLATENYSRRPWCRREVLIAKKLGRPVVIVDGLQNVDVRSFPYSGNVPVVAWGDQGARRAVDLLLKEVLRLEHAKCVLERQRRPEDVVLASAPELVTLAALPRGTSVLYPDPPLGDEEMEVLDPLGHRLETPLQRAGAERGLAGRRIALSASASDDLARHGLWPEHLETALLRLSCQLLMRGAALAYGGHLGPHSYTRRLFDLVRSHSAVARLPPVERLRNYAAWPQPLTVQERAELREHVRFVRVPRPEGVADLDPQAFVEEPPVRFEPDTPQRRYAWARGMTAMREQQSRETDARIVIGGLAGPSRQADGSVKWYAGRIPGVVEEALATLRAGRPLYLCAAFGGAGALLADLVEGRPRADFRWEVHRGAPHAEALRALYAARGDAWEDYADIAAAFARTGVRGLAERNGLSETENRALFSCRDAVDLVALLLRGIGRVLPAEPADPGPTAPPR